MKVIPVNCFKDNYSYLIIDENAKVAAAVDPAEPKNVLETANKAGVKLTHVLTTHHHSDHDGGNEFIKASIPNILIYGGDSRIKAISHKVAHNEVLQVGNINIKTLFTPCHTSGHVLYYIESQDSCETPALFTGDTLFIAGCGRFFEGNPEEMHHALNTVIANLPHDTQLYCGHEYTVSNLKFAHYVEPDNIYVTKKLEWAKIQQEKKIPTIPSTIEQELKINPFMRLDSNTIKETLRLDKNASPVEVMGKLREAKNNFRG